MDPILAADRLPKLAARAMRGAIVAAALLPAGSGRAAPTHRSLVNNALIRFERGVQRIAGSGIRPALLFAVFRRLPRGGRRLQAMRIIQRRSSAAPANHCAASWSMIFHAGTVRTLRWPRLLLADERSCQAEIARGPVERRVARNEF